MTVLADTPATIIPMLMLSVAAMASPVIVVWALTLVCRRSSRTHGLIVILSGVVGAALCCAIWAMLGRFVHVPLSHVEAATWVGLIAGGFGALGGFALVVGYASGLFRT